jgi:N-acyl-D-amino-acid deacylase
VLLVWQALFAQADLVIRNALIADGSGSAAMRGDIAIKDGRISSIGKLESLQAARTIDAKGRVVSPGFIDVHTHIEGTVEKVPRGDNYLLDGVTTVVTGNCGSSAVKLGEWFSKLEKLGLGLNVAALIGHNSVRREVMDTVNRAATADELLRMQDLVDQAMREGAVGFSTGLIYIPGTYSNTAEVVSLAKSAARHGGVYASHMRDEGAQIREAIEEAVQVGRESGLPVQISHFKIDNRRLWGRSTDSIALVESFRKEGLKVFVDQYPYDHSSTNLGITLPSWALADGPQAIKERLASAGPRARIAAEMKRMLAEKGQPDYSYAIVARFEPEPAYEGKNIAEINLLKGRTRSVDNEIRTILELMERGGAGMVYHSMSMEDVERIMRYPHTAIASDGGIREFGLGMPHPRSYGTNARVLAEFVRKRKVLTLGDAIRRMTSLPAGTFGFRDRGLLKEGNAADLVVFDPAKVQDRATYQDPHQYTEGFDFVIVNGTVMVEDGKLTEARGGRILRRIN